MGLGLGLDIQIASRNGSGVAQADRFVTTDAELTAAIAAQPTATTPWIIELANSGTFTSIANIDSKTAITLRGQTYGVPHLQAGLTAASSTNCKVLGLKITRLAPNSTAPNNTSSVVEIASSSGIEVAYCEISSNPLANIVMQDGASGSTYFQGYRGIGGSTGLGVTNFNLHHNYIHDTYRGHSVVGSAGSVNYIEYNTIIDSYQNPAEMTCFTGGTIYYRHNDSLGTWARSVDPGSPHSSNMGFSANAAWTPIVIGNIAICAVERRYNLSTTDAVPTYAAASGPKFNDPSGTAMNYINGVFAYNIVTGQDGIGLEVSFGNFTIVNNTVLKDSVAGGTLTPSLNYHDIGANSQCAKNIFPGFALGASNVNGIHSSWFDTSFDNISLRPDGLSAVAGDLHSYDFHLTGPTFTGWTIANIVGRVTPKVTSYVYSEGIGAVGTGYDWTTRSYTSLPTLTKPKTTNTSPATIALTQFDGVNDWLQMTGAAPLLGMTNRRALTIAFHATFDGTDATDCYYTEANSADYSVRKLSTSGRIRYNVKNNAGAAVLTIDSAQQQLAADGSDPAKRLWLLTVNMTTGRIFLMRGKELDPFFNITTLKNDDLCNTRSAMGLMGQSDTTPPAGTGLLNGRLGRFYMTDQFIDLGVVANHNNIVATDGTPTDWGSNGSNVTGTQPRAYVYGDAAIINAGGGVNYGSFATKFIINGSVTNA